jgi:hypothetical protein
VLLCRGRIRLRWIVFGKKGEEYAFKFGTKAKEPTSLGVADALGLFEAGMAEQSEQTSDAFEPVYENIKATG